MYHPPTAPPSWVHGVVSVVASARDRIDSATHTGLSSDAVLRELRPGLQEQGFAVEASKRQADRIRRPVLFGDGASERVAYEVDGVAVYASGRLALPFEGVLLFGY